MAPQAQVNPRSRDHVPSHIVSLKALGLSPGLQDESGTWTAHDHLNLKRWQISAFASGALSGIRCCGVLGDEVAHLRVYLIVPSTAACIGVLPCMSGGRIQWLYAYWRWIVHRHMILQGNLVLQGNSGSGQSLLCHFVPHVYQHDCVAEEVDDIPFALGGCL